jgi:sugar phosphate isomerase/epimerase
VHDLARHGFDGTISLEYEDPLVDGETSVRRSAELLAAAL